MDSIPIPAILQVIKRLTPNGGVVIPTARFTIIIIPKCTGSIPRDVAMGRRMGVKMTSAAEDSKNIPIIKSKALTSKRYTELRWQGVYTWKKMITLSNLILLKTCSWWVPEAISIKVAPLGSLDRRGPRIWYNSVSDGDDNSLTCSRSRPSAVITYHMRGGCQDRYFAPFWFIYAAAFGAGKSSWSG